MRSGSEARGDKETLARKVPSPAAMVAALGLYLCRGGGPAGRPLAALVFGRLPGVGSGSRSSSGAAGHVADLDRGLAAHLAYSVGLIVGVIVLLAIAGC